MPIGFVESVREKLTRPKTKIWTRGSSIRVIHNSLDTVAKYDLTDEERNAVNLLLERVKIIRNIA